jgi:hypothetical protein
MFTHVTQPTRPLFILGVERCGSSWLANIFDSSPATLLYAEPFAPFNRVFPGWPERLQPLASLPRALTDVLDDGTTRLFGYKYPLFDGPDAGALAHGATSALFAAHELFARLARLPTAPKALRYRQLRFPAEHNALRFSKRTPADLVVVKELRLNFQTGAIRGMWPEAKFVVVLRDPLAQLASILGLLRKGSLSQLAELLRVFPEVALGQRRFARFRAQLEAASAGSTVERAVAYWFVNYTVLIEDLADAGASVLRHEDLSADAANVTARLFGFAGLDYGSPTASYVEASTQTERKGVSPWDTTRVSKDYHRRVLAGLDPEFVAAFRAAAAPWWDVGAAELATYRA